MFNSSQLHPRLLKLPCGRTAYPPTCFFLEVGIMSAGGEDSTQDIYQPYKKTIVMIITLVLSTEMIDKSALISCQSLVLRQENVAAGQRAFLFFSVFGLVEVMCVAQNVS